MIEKPEKPEATPESEEPETTAKPRKRKAAAAKKKRKTKKSAASSKSNIKLVIVESPAKSKTILKCLGRGYKIAATMGHIRDLPANKMGIDIEGDFTPTYRTIRGKGDTIKDLKKQAKNADKIYLALDLDREGEAIAWHVSQILEIPEEKLYRITFNEITPEAIREAVKNPTKLDMDKVNAQQARRLLDRLVGYKLSPLLWKKIAKGLSAGRVQSVAVRLIVEREKEIEAFVSKEYWEMDARLRGSEDRDPFIAALEKIKGEKHEIPDREAADAVVAGIEGKPWTVTTIEKRRTRKKPPPPFTTSLLQQAASTRLRFSTKKTMRIAQQLYEGVDIGAEGPVGLITYMRTDSFRIAPTAAEATKTYVEEHFGKDYVPEKPNVYGKRKRAQEAHEAIRPTDISRTPESIKKNLSKDQWKLYEMIWGRFAASQMSPAVYDVASALIDVGDCTFRARGRHMIFDGYTIVLGKSSKEEEQFLPPLEEGQELKLEELMPRQCFTKPPPRYSEASLVKTLEKEGIGRPSTYAPIISTIVDRGYVRLEKRAFHATELGTLVTEKLVKWFANIMDVQFTSSMEENLDKIEENHANWVSTLKEFYSPFEKDLEEAHEKMETVKGQADGDGEPCPECGGELVVRWSRAGKFLGCTGFPKCRVTKSIGEDALQEVVENEPPCEKCGQAMVIKAGRRGKFLACSGYPDCRNTRPIPTPHDCPEEGCDGKLVLRSSKRGRRFYGCSRYPDCKYTSSKLPEDKNEDGTEDEKEEEPE